MRHLLALPLLILIVTSLACNTLLPPRPEVVWNTSPKSLVVTADTCCGMMYDPNGIPDFRLWGDGRVVWVEYDNGGGRQVLTATIAPADMTKALQAIVDTGFFGWKDFYEPPYQVYDAPSTCVNVYLTSNSKSVCSLMSEPPADFYTLTSKILEGYSGSDYVPPTGHLQASVVNKDFVSGSVLEWPVDSVGVSLSDLQSGQWVEGEALHLAWQVVNTQPFNAIVQEDGVYYTLVLLVPDLTRQQPPLP